MKNEIIFFGTEEFSAVSLQALIDANFNVVGVVTKPDAKKGRGQKIQEPTVKKIATQYNIPVIQPQRIDEIVPFIQQFNKPTGVLVSFGKIIPQKIMDLFNIGIINVHPSLLPKYRGPSPIESAILNGDTHTGVSIMLLSKDMDAGPVYAQEVIKLKGDETSSQLYDICGQIGAQMLIELLPAILSKKMTPTSQLHDHATYCQLLSKKDGILEPDTQTAIEAERRIRAFQIFPKSRLEIRGKTCIIKSAQINVKGPENLSVKFSDGNYLQINELTAPSGKTMTSTSFKNGYIK